MKDEGNMKKRAPDNLLAINEAVFRDTYGSAETSPND